MYLSQPFADDEGENGILFMNNENSLSAWEKMQLDMIYDDFDQDLFNRRVEAKNIFNKFNQTTDEQVEERKALLEQLFGSIGENVYVEPTFNVSSGVAFAEGVGLCRGGCFDLQIYAFILT